MNYGEIKKYDIADGEGVRVVLFVSGCTHHCKGCFNEETWDFHYGNPFTEDTVAILMSALAPKYISGLTVLGGEPFEIVNQRSLLPLLKKVRKTFPLKSIWCYTGYTLEKDLLNGGKVHCEATDEILGLLDVLVDGEFIEERKDISLLFCGSSNQRIIDVRRTLSDGKVALRQ